MTRVLNQLDADTAARVRAAISGKPVLKEAKAPKAPPGPKAMCQRLHRYYTATNTHVIQLPHHLTQPKRFVPPRGMTAAQIKWRLMREAEEHEQFFESVCDDIQHYLPRGIEGLRAIEYVRFSRYAGGPNEMDDDNLSACFKAVRDAVCAYARWGPEWRKHRDAVGHADGYLKRQGITWAYKQRKCEANPRAHGIQIWLHCAPPT